jgi:methylene-tetrahydromethanopterin dehydrogenase
MDAFMGESHIVLGAAKAGLRVLRSDQLAKAEQLIVAADVNAVPPLGIEGIDVNDMGKVLEASPSDAVGIGALAIGDIKYKVHYRLFKMMLDVERKSPLYVDHDEAFKVAREIAKEKINRA